MNVSAQGNPSIINMSEHSNVTDMSTYERMLFLKNTELFASFDKTHIEEIAWLVTERRYAGGDWLCHEGDEGHELFVICEGRVAVVKNIDGKHKTVYTAKPGEVLGEISVLGHIPRTAGLRAKGDVLVLTIKAPHFIRLLRENPDMSLAIIELLVHRLAA